MAVIVVLDSKVRFSFASTILPVASRPNVWQPYFTSQSSALAEYCLIKSLSFFRAIFNHPEIVHGIFMLILMSIWWYSTYYEPVIASVEIFPYSGNKTAALYFIIKANWIFCWAFRARVLGMGSSPVLRHLDFIAACAVLNKKHLWERRAWIYWL